MVISELGITTSNLLTLLTASGRATFTYRNKQYILQSIEREDGSGKSFNLYCKDCDNRPCSIYTRLVD